jgi:hypothetical protein
MEVFLIDARTLPQPFLKQARSLHHIHAANNSDAKNEKSNLAEVGCGAVCQKYSCGESRPRLSVEHSSTSFLDSPQLPTPVKLRSRKCVTPVTDTRIFAMAEY